MRDTISKKLSLTYGDEKVSGKSGPVLSLVTLRVPAARSGVALPGNGPLSPTPFLTRFSRLKSAASRGLGGTP